MNDGEPRSGIARLLYGFSRQRSPSEFQSSSNPIQADRITESDPLQIEIVGPRRGGLFALFVTLYFLTVPVAAIIYCVFFVSGVRTGKVQALAESCYIILGFFLATLNMPRIAGLVLRNPFVAIAFLLFIPAYFSRDSIALRLVLGFALTAFAADLIASNSLWLGTALPVSPETRHQTRSHWHHRLVPGFRGLPGMEFYWLIFLGVLLVPFGIMLMPFHPYFPYPGGRQFVYGIGFLILLPWVVEKVSAFLFNRRGASFVQMVRGFFAAMYEWLTYESKTRQAPGAVNLPVDSIIPRRRIFYGVMIILILALIPIHMRDAIYSAQYMEDFKQKLEAQVPNPAPVTNPAQTAGQAFQSRLEQISDEQLVEILKSAINPNGIEPVEKKPAISPATVAKKKNAEDGVNDFLFRRHLDLFGERLAYVVIGSLPLQIHWIAPFAYFIAIAFALTARTAAHYPVRPPGNPFNQPLNHSLWTRIVSDLSRYQSTARSIFLGVNAIDYSPIVVPRQVFQEHAHVLGDTGSGKTSLGLAPLIAQFIRMQDCSVIVIDLKGDDLALMDGTRIEAERAGLPFRWFSNEIGKPTFAFNPLLQSGFSQLSLYQKTDVITNALGLQYGSDYGRGYFSDANAQVLYQALKKYPDIQSFEQLVAILENPVNFKGVSKQLQKDGAHLLAIIARLASYAPLNVTSSSGSEPAVLENSIDFSKLFETPQVCYCYLSSALGTATSSEMGRLALYSLLTAAKNAPLPRKQVFLIIDEFQRLTAKNLELFLQTARSFNIGVILANQANRDLKTTEVDLSATVKANCRLKQYFSISDPMEIAELSKSAGDTVIHNRSFSILAKMAQFAFSGIVYDSLSYSEQVVPRISTNQILLAGDHPQQSIVQIRRGAGYAQFGGFPFILQGCHHISFDEFERRRKADWPAPQAETMVPINSAPNAEPIASQLPLFDSPLIDNEISDDNSRQETARNWRKSLKNKTKKTTPKKGD